MQILAHNDYQARPPAAATVLVLANDANALDVNLDGITQIDLHFPAFTDGRAFSQAYLLRRRLQVCGRHPRHRRCADRPAGADAAHGLQQRRAARRRGRGRCPAPVRALRRLLPGRRRRTRCPTSTHARPPHERTCPPPSIWPRVNAELGRDAQALVNWAVGPGPAHHRHHQLPAL